MPRKVIRASAAPTRSAGNGRTRRRMKGKAARRNQPAADPKPFVFRPWFHFLCEAKVSASTGWSEIAIPTLKSAVKAQLKLVDEQQIDIRLRNVAMWNLNVQVSAGSQIPIGIASSYAVDEKDANLVQTTTGTSDPPRAPVSFQNVVEDLPGKSSFARVKVAWPGSQQKKVWADSYNAVSSNAQGTTAVNPLIGNSTQYDVPAFYYTGNSDDLVIRFSGWWRPVEAASAPPLPTKIMLVGVNRGLMREEKVIGLEAKIKNPDFMSGEPVHLPREGMTPVVKKFKKPKASPPPSVAPSDSVSNVTRDKRTTRSQAFKQWKTTFSTTSSTASGDVVSLADFNQFKKDVMDALAQIRHTSNAAASEVRTAKANVVATIAEQRGLPQRNSHKGAGSGQTGRTREVKGTATAGGFDIPKCYKSHSFQSDSGAYHYKAMCGENYIKTDVSLQYVTPNDKIQWMRLQKSRWVCDQHE